MKERSYQLRKMTKAKRFALVSIIMVLIATMVFSGLNVSAAQIKADDSTIDKWEQTTGQDTKNIGRIWTDKSVFTENVTLPASDAGVAPEIKIGDSDFLVALSALSSAGSITGETISTKPLDIVLVLDTSGSMGDSMGGYTYVPTYNIRENGRTAYYAEVDGEYVEVDRVTTGLIIQRFDHWEVNGQRVEPKTSANDNDSGHIQFYTYSSGIKMEALKTAATSFVNSTLAENKEISDVDKQHRISLVTFAGSANTRHELTTVNTDSAAEINGTINNLNANGATAADYAMNNTKAVLESAREGAQKVVIFFTDGEPNHQNGFDGDVANAAIATAKTLKDADTKMYSIGMFSAANPDDTSNRFNAYMHGVSSNYPDATSYTNLGNRATNADNTPTDYYKKASDFAELSKVFDEIFREISSIEASSPFEDGTGLNGENMAAVTFHDELGDYMKVDDFKSIVFADKVFTDPQIMESPVEGEDKKIIQYEFTGTADTDNSIYPTGDLSQLEITVERYDDPAKGDVVTVTIPASMIPLREYVVDTTSGKEVMTIDDTFPLRIFYGASLKDEAKDLLADPDKAMQDYIAANKNAEDQVNFYSNKYYKDGSNNGGVYVEFEPNDTNDFYYFQENEPLYLDKDCTQRATGELDTSGDTIYYYDRLYYAMENGKPVEQHNIVKIPGNSNIVLEGFVASDAEGLYIPSGTPRTTSLATHALNKTTNETGTATYVTAPDWDDLNNPKNVIVKLGNNGLLPVDLPGTLEVTKKVTADEGLTAPADAEFDFTLDLTAPQDGSLKTSYKAQKFDKNNDPVGDEFTIVDGGTFKLTADQTVRVYGLENGVGYKVTEAEHKGFTTTATGDSGTIVKNQTATAAFTNTYKVEDLIIHAEDFGLKGTKNITGRDFESGDAFRFEIKASALAETSPLPTNPTEEIEPTSGTSAEISFGDFTFDKPGHYRYTISEFLPNGDDTAADKFDKVLPGMTYDTTEYRLVVDVTDDNGDGELELKNLEIAKRVNSATNEWEVLYSNADGDLPTRDYLNFTNTYSVDTQDISLVGTKVLENKSFADYGTKGQFGFKIEAIGSRAVDSEASVEWTEDANQPMPTASGSDHGNNVYSNSATGVISIPGITFGHDEVGKEYKYEIKKLQPLDKDTGAPLEGAEQNSDGKWVYNGVTLDNSTKEIIIKVKSTNVNNQEVIQATVTGNNFTFTNTYNAETDYAFSGKKTITNRNFKDGDTFTFKVEAQNGAPAPERTEVTIEPKGGAEAAVSFGNIHFTQDDVKDAELQADGSRSKTFTYRVWEETGNIGGIKYDSTVRTVKITVTDDGAGNLTAVATDDSAALEWNNVYEASMTYSTGIDVQKTLTGRNMKAGEFDFTITPQDGTPAVGDSDAKFKNGVSAAGIPSVMTKKLSTLKFTQADGGKTFTYLIDETEPATAAGNGVTYDKTQYRVEIVPTDNGDGTMTATTTVYRTVDKEGNVLDTPVKLTADEKIAFNNSYAPAPGTLPGATNLEVTKNFTGREDDKWLDSDEFTFEIELDTESLPAGVTADDVQMPADTTITIDDADADKKASFGNITFKKPGTYTFAVVEKQDGLADKGITGDTVTKIIKILVTDPGTGTLVATKDGNNSDALYFTNTYEAEEVTFAGINVEKTLPADRGWKDGDSFTFKLEGNDQDEATMDAIEAGNVVLPNPATVEITKDDQDHTKAFGEITFKQVGEYSFKVTEVVPADNNKIPGIGYSTETKIVNIVVTDNHEGELVAKVKTGDTTTADSTTVTIANTYTPADTDPVSTTDLFTKAIDGRDWLDTDAFTFTIDPQDGAPTPVDADGDVVTEVTVTSDTAKNGDEVAFAFGTITFGAADMANATVNNGVKTKTFTYHITENDFAADAMPGMTKDSHTAIMSITVTDDGTGKLTAANPVITGTPTDTDGDFVNTYRTSLDYGAMGGLAITKKLDGRDMEAGQFKFKVTADDATMEKFNFGVDTFVNESAKDGVVSTVKTFKNIQFTQDDAGKEYEFTVAETDKASPGYTYDKTKYDVLVSVEDDNQGKLTVTTTVNNKVVATWSSDDQKPAEPTPITFAFENRYAATADAAASVAGTKVLNGRPIGNLVFDFEISTRGRTDGEQTVATGQNDANGNITFTAIDKALTYDIDKLKQAVKEGYAVFNGDEDKDVYTVNYQASEKTGTLPKGVTATNYMFNFSVSVVDNGDGTLTSTTNYPAGNDKLVFVNDYATQSSTTAYIQGMKYLNKADADLVPPTIDKEFTFTLEAITEGAPMPDETSVENNGNGNVLFGDITFTPGHLAGVTADPLTGVREKTFAYQVTESGGMDDVTNDQDETKSFTITLKDDGQGHLTATVGANPLAFIFTNLYDPEKPVVTIEGDKTLTGRDLLEGEEFNFTLTGTDANSVAVAGGETLTAKVDVLDNQGKADFSFKTLTFTKPGTYTFKVAETAGDKGGMTYSDEEYTVTVVVDGQLNIDPDNGITYTNKEGVEIADKKASFLNEYTTTPATYATADAHLKKVLTGRDWKDGETFEFTIEALDGAPEPKNTTVTVTKPAKGNETEFDFGTITFDEPGTYKYEVTETNGGKTIDGLTYTDNTATIEVVVTDRFEDIDYNGRLTAEVTVAKETFTNVYQSSLDYGAMGGLAITKQLNGRDMAKDQFEFTITPEDDASKAKFGFGDTPLKSEAANDGAVSLVEAFTDITFDQDDAGKTYAFTVEETKGGNENEGYTNDTTKYDVAVAITDDTLGHLTATTTVNGDEVAEWTADMADTETITLPFVNAYDATSNELAFDLTKELTGRPLQNGEFKFVINSVKTDGTEPQKIAEGTNDKDGKITFDKAVTYTMDELHDLVKAGRATETNGDYTVYYQAVEDTTGLKDKGISSTVSSFKFNVTVHDNGDGTMTATANYPDGSTFKNVYATNATADVNVNGLKSLEKADGLEPPSIDEKFTFTLEAVSKDAPLPTVKTTTNKDGKIVFAEPIVFSVDLLKDVKADENGVRTRTFEYRVVESGEMEDVKNADPQTFTVTLKDDGKGKLTATTTQNDLEFVFENEYVPETPTAAVQGHKTLTGRDLLEGEVFNFTLEGKDDQSKAVLGNKALTAKVDKLTDGEADFAFDAIAFERPGTYEFVVSETKGDKGGMTYSDEVYTVSIVVDKQLNIVDGAVTYKNKAGEAKDKAEFINSYSAEAATYDTVNAQLKKVLTGRDWKDGETFEFTIKALDGAPAPAKETVTVTKPEKGNEAAFDFGTIKFDETGTYVYEITETNGGKTIDGLTYAGHTAKITVKVTDEDANGTAFNGKLKAAATVENGTFENVYKADIDYGAIGGLKVTKKLDGTAMEAGKFQFNIEADDEASAEKLGITDKTLTAGAANDGEKITVKTFTDIKFNQTDIGKTYGFTLNEVNGGKTKDGYTYDGDSYDVKITINDNQNGTLTAVTTVNGKEVAAWKTGAEKTEPIELAFENSYAASTADGLNIEATKDLVGRPIGDLTFDFGISTKGRTGGEKTVTTGINNGNNITFNDAFAYTIESLKQAVAEGYATYDAAAKAYTVNYNAYEVVDKGLPAGVSASNSSFDFSVTVTDNGDGSLSAKANYPEGGIAFVNTYATINDDLELHMKGSKIIDSEAGLTPPSMDGAFSFQISAVNGGPLPKNTEVSSDGQGNVDFGAAVFTADLLKDVEADPETGVRTKTFNYEVTESGDVAGVTNEGGVKSFSVTLTDDGQGNLTVTGDPAKAPMFTFTNTYGVDPETSSVTDQIKVQKVLTGRAMEAGEFTFELVDNATGEVVATAENDEEGNIVFDALTYDKPGTHAYTVREVKGDRGGVTYDNKTFLITTEVTDNSDGTLKVTHSTADDEEVVFNNSYDVIGTTTVVLGAAKSLENKDLEAGQFSFELKDETGNVIATAENDVNGSIAFPALEYGKDDIGKTYDYTITEINDKQDNVKYDESVYKVSVTVSDNGEGSVIAEVEGDTAVFTNVYNEPEPPAPEPPEEKPTPQTGDNLMIGLYIALLLTAAIAFLVFRRMHAEK